MTLTVVELNDAGVRVTRDGRVVCESAGVAVIEQQRVLTGAAASARAWAVPRAVNDRFWQQLNERPLPQATRHCRHHADLAFHHLRAVLAAAGRPTEAVLVTPGHYSEEQLALVLGIAGAAGLKASGLIDPALAALAGCAPQGRYLVADLHLHHASLSTVRVDDEVTREAHAMVEHTGLKRIHAACIEVVAGGLLRQARFDALRDAETEQLLYQHLPQWLNQAGHGDELRLALDHRGSRFTARIPARDFRQVIAAALAPLSEHVRGDAQVLISAALAALPGAADCLAAFHALPADACYRGVAEHRAALASANGGVAFTARLPRARTPLFEAHAEGGHALNARNGATHVLAGNLACALGPAPLYLHADGSLGAVAGSGAHCSITLESTRAILRANGVETRVNGEVVNGLRDIRPGDLISIEGGRTLFIPIVVSDHSAA